MRRFEHTSGLRKSGHICALRQDDVRQNNPFLPFRWRGRSADLPDVSPSVRFRFELHGGLAAVDDAAGGQGDGSRWPCQVRSRQGRRTGRSQ
jgi:hypothetical protein